MSETPVSPTDRAAAMMAEAEAIMDQMRPMLENQHRDAAACAMVNLMAGFVMAEETRQEAEDLVKAIHERLTDVLEKYWQKVEIKRAGGMQ